MLHDTRSGVRQIDAIRLEKVRDLLVQESSQPGRPAHVSAASGLVCDQERLYVVADDELHLGIFPLSGDSKGALVRILPGELAMTAADRKRGKPDFESLVLLPATRTRPQGGLLALGSGSAASRHRGVIIPFDERRTLELPALTVVDLTQLFDSTREAVGEINIEGTVVTRDAVLLLQRGNKGDGISAIVRFDLAEFFAHLDGALDLIRPTSLRSYELGSIRDVPLSFSDACALADGSIVFSAIAEDTNDAYADGPCTGAAIGILDRDGDVRRLFEISGGAKIEGIHAESRGADIDILCVSDADDARIPAALYRGVLHI